MTVDAVKNTSHWTSLLSMQCLTVKY